MLENEHSAAFYIGQTTLSLFFIFIAFMSLHS